jgi:hypothetical protein
MCALLGITRHNTVDGVQKSQKDCWWSDGEYERFAREDIRRPHARKPRQEKHRIIFLSRKVDSLAVSESDCDPISS